MRSEATRIIVGHDVAVAEWVRQRLERVHDWGPCQAIGVARGDELIAGVVYNNLIWPSIEASVASTDPGWCSRRNLAAIFAYPFRLLWAGRSDRGQPVRAFLCRLGFREEGLCRQALPSGDAVIYGMTPEECRWLGKTRHVEALSPLLDTLFGNTQGTIAFRSASGWAGFTPGPVGALLQTQGPGANLVWSRCGYRHHQRRERRPGPQRRRHIRERDIGLGGAGGDRRRGHQRERPGNGTRQSRRRAAGVEGSYRHPDRPDPGAGR
jgi:hypothetical protein